MQLGDKIRRVPSISKGEAEPSTNSKKQKKLRETAYDAEVVYIHPKRRFYTVRFKFPYGSFCESFHF